MQCYACLSAKLACVFLTLASAQMQESIAQIALLQHPCERCNGSWVFYAPKKACNLLQSRHCVQQITARTSSHHLYCTVDYRVLLAFLFTLSLYVAALCPLNIIDSALQEHAQVNICQSGRDFQRTAKH